jgi:hypothetical protein
MNAGICFSFIALAWGWWVEGCLDHGARERRSFTLPAWGGTGITFSAQKHFGRYHSQCIPSYSAYRNDILSLLEDLEYARHHFLFFPRTNSKEEKGLPVRSEIFQTIQQGQ